MIQTFQRDIWEGERGVASLWKKDDHRLCVHCVDYSLSPGPGIINGDVVFGRATPLVIGKSRLFVGRFRKLTILRNVVKGVVHPKMKILSLITQLHVISKPLSPSFIFGAQIKMVLIKSESSLTLHRQERNWNVPRPRNIVRTSVNSPCDISGPTSILWSYENTFFCAKKT